jgi:hypothetical protein
MQKPHSVIMASRSDVGVLFTDIRLPGFVDGMELARLVNLKTAVGRLEVAAFCDFARSGCVNLARDAAAGATIDL